MDESVISSSSSGDGSIINLAFLDVADETEPQRPLMVLPKKHQDPQRRLLHRQGWWHYLEVSEYQ